MMVSPERRERKCNNKKTKKKVRRAITNATTTFLFSDKARKRGLMLGRQKVAEHNRQ